MTDMEDHRRRERTEHPATDHHLEPTLSSLSGSDVTLHGTKSDGSPYGPRLLENVSFVPRGGTVFAIGMDPEAGGIRQFDLARVDRLLSPAEPHERAAMDMDRQAVLAVLDRSLQELRRRSDGGSR